MLFDHSCLVYFPVFHQFLLKLVHLVVLDPWYRDKSLVKGIEKLLRFLRFVLVHANIWLFFAQTTQEGIPDF